MFKSIPLGFFLVSHGIWGCPVSSSYPIDGIFLIVLEDKERLLGEDCLHVPFDVMATKDHVGG